MKVLNLFEGKGRAKTEAVSRWLPTAAATGSRPGLASGISGGQSDVGASFLRVLRFPLPKPFIPPTSPSSSSSSSQTCKRKIEVPPIGERPHVAPFKGAKSSRESKLAQRNVDI
jgi:hypothetical protein